ncbi:MAG: ThuA domain-containing protein [Spirochaetaceae bacterium]|jgi:trehalose utilization protein|nr:ThuA domain-containing protein [Spirochaetaceae bacterium]
MSGQGSIRVTVWNEYTDEQKKKEVTDVYPGGLHNTIAGFLNKDENISAKTTVITDPEQGLPDSLLENTDVLIWWGHIYHDRVDDKRVLKVVNQVHQGMGIIFLHSAHRSKPFLALTGASGRLSWREAEEKSRVWTADPAHPIAAGIPENFALEREEMYSEPFGIPQPESTVFISWFEGGNVFRSGVTFRRDYGKIFYFQPGHETYPAYHNEIVQRVIINAVKWVNPLVRVSNRDCPNVPALERITPK